MSRTSSHAGPLNITLNQVLAVVATTLVGFLGYFLVRYIDKEIPAMVKAEVTSQISSNLKTQVADEIKLNVGNQIQANKDELSKTINENNRYVNDKIIGIYEMVREAQMLARDC